jgi:hypothetical protein
MAMQSAWLLPEGVKSIEVNGYPMAYHEGGSGMPLSLVHVQYSVIAVSLRHYFPEPWDGRGDDFSILQHADDLAEGSTRPACCASGRSS